MDILENAIGLIMGGNADLYNIITLSLKVSLSATFIAALFAIPLGAMLAIYKFPGRQGIVVLSTALMALPPVVVGLGVYLMLSRSGPLGSWGLLFTPSAMVIAQTVLIFPIILALTREAVLPLNREYQGLMSAMDVHPFLRLRTLIWDARFAVVTALLGGFGRALAEVGAVIIVGGNINGSTRVMTTTIALETSKGNLELALALGMILLTIALCVNIIMHSLGRIGARHQVVRS
jgi:tungstate transport system permease protein